MYFSELKPNGKFSISDCHAVRAEMKWNTDVICENQPTSPDRPGPGPVITDYDMDGILLVQASLGSM